MSVVLNGSTQYLYRSGSLGTMPFTVVAWAKKTNTTNNGAVFAHNGANSYNNGRVLIMAGAATGDPVQAFMGMNVSAGTAATPVGFAAGSWVHVAAIFSSTTSRTVFYQGGNKTTNTTSVTPNTSSTSLGRWHDGSAWLYTFGGKLAEVALYNKALSDQEIADLASGVYPSQVAVANLVAYWPLVSNANDAYASYNWTEYGTPTYDAGDVPGMHDLITYVDMAVTPTGGTGGGNARLVIPNIIDLSALAGGSGGGSGNLTRIRGLSAADGGHGGGDGMVFLAGAHVDIGVTAGGQGNGNGVFDPRAFVPMAVMPTGGVGGGEVTRLQIMADMRVAPTGGVGGGEAFLLSHVWLDEFRAGTRIVAAGNDQLWYEDIDVAAGTMVELVAARDDIDTSDQLVMFSLFQKVFVVNGSKKKVADFGNVKITTANITGNAPDRGNILTGETSGAQMVVDFINTDTGAASIYGMRTTDATFVTGETATGTDDDDNPISFTLNANEVAGPHWYNWTPYANNEAAFGKLPEKVYLGCPYAGRAVLAGNPSYPYQWYMSRQDNPFDWNYVATDVQRATAGGSGNLGQLGDMVRALIPWKDDALAFGCANSFIVLRGNPTDGGYMENIDTRIGVFGQDAWCFDSDGDLYFWGSGGVYKSSRGFGTLTNLTAQTYPDIVDIEQADPTTHRIGFGYDPRNEGIEISVTKLSDGSNSCYWLDLKTGGFYPDKFDNEHGAYSMAFYDANDPDYKHLLVGCKDGYIRRFGKTSANDDGLAIDSYVDYGPIQLADQPDHEGLIFSVEAELGGGGAGGAEPDSNNVTWRIWADRAADAINEKLDANAAPNIGGTFQAPGRRKGGAVKRKVKGVYGGIKLRNNALNESWAFEKLIVGIRPAGRAK